MLFRIGRSSGFDFNDGPFGQGFCLEIGGGVGGRHGLVKDLRHARKTVEHQTESGQERSKVTQVGEPVSSWGFRVLVVSGQLPNKSRLFSIPRGVGAHDFAALESKE